MFPVSLAIWSTVETADDFTQYQRNKIIFQGQNYVNMSELFSEENPALQ